MPASHSHRGKDDRRRHHHRHHDHEHEHSRKRSRGEVTENRDLESRGERDRTFGHHKRHRPSSHSPPRPSMPVRIKQEPLSSDEENHRPARRGGDRHANHRRPHRREDPSRSRWDDSGDESRGERRRRGNQESFPEPSSSSGAKNGSKKAEEPPKDKPNMQPSGKLAEETNMYKGILIKYSEPDEARKPRTRWRLYVFKGEENLPTLHIHRQSAYLLGRERRIADIPLDHPSCSKQHAALQFRVVAPSRKPRPYVMDLESANGTYLNNQKIDPRRYVELFEKDVLRFGYSSREYVLLHEGSRDSEPLPATSSSSPPLPPTSASPPDTQPSLEDGDQERDENEEEEVS